MFKYFAYNLVHFGTERYIYNSLHTESMNSELIGKYINLFSQNLVYYKYTHTHRVLQREKARIIYILHVYFSQEIV